MIQVLHADDHAIVREGVRALLLTEADIQLVASAKDGVEAVQQALSLHPDVIIMDLQMPNKSGLEAIVEIRQALANARILVVTSFAEDETVFSAIKAGAQGYLLKDSTPQELLKSIRDVYNGRLSLHPAVAAKVLQELHRPASLKPTSDPLTVRELDILKLVAQGMTYQDIAETLVVSERTVRTHVSNILSKLHLANRTQAALYALREGIARLDEL